MIYPFLLYSSKFKKGEIMEEIKLYEDEKYAVTSERFIVKATNEVYPVYNLGGGKINVAQSISGGIFFTLIGLGLMSIGGIGFIITGLLILGVGVWLFRGDPHYNIFRLDDYEYIIRYIPKDIALKLYQSISKAKNIHEINKAEQLRNELDDM
jgi:hypothetical protein